MHSAKYAVLIAVLCLVGCKPVDNHAEIQGAVTLDGEPLAEGSILFVPIEGTAGIVTGAPIVAGRYKIDIAKGPAVGRNQVQIQALRLMGKKIPNPFSPSGAPIEMREGAIPARFNSASELTVDVHDGVNTADFEVQSK